MPPTLHSSKSFILIMAVVITLIAQVKSQSDSNDWSDLLKEISSTLELAKRNIWNEI